jgi:hypothetical protein
VPASPAFGRPSSGASGPAPGLRNNPACMRRELLTAPLAATGLIAGYGVAVASGSRPLGGVLMGCCGLVCISVWLERDGRRTAAALTAVGLLAFALSHALAMLVGAWPAVLIAAAATAAACWRYSDVRVRAAVR